MEARFSSPETGQSTPENNFFSPEPNRNGRIYFRSASIPSFSLHSQQTSSMSQPSGKVLPRKSLSARHLRRKEFSWDFQKSASVNHLRSTDSGLPNLWQDSSQESTPDPSQDPLVEQEREGRDAWDGSWLEHINLLCQIIANHPNIVYFFMKKTRIYKEIEQKSPGLLCKVLSPARLKMLSNPEMVRSIIRMDHAVSRLSKKDN